MNNRVHDSIVEHAVTDERERCAKIAEEMASTYRAQAALVRATHTFTTRELWPPPFRKVTCVMPRWEQYARDMEAAAHSHGVVARCILRGYRPHSDEKARIDIAPCRCQREMGNDYWFLPAGKCLHGKCPNAPD